MSRQPKTLPDYDAWVFARLMFGHDLEGEQALVTASSRPLVDHLAGLPIEGRQAAWDAFVEDDPHGEAWVEAVAAIDPEAEAPEADPVEAGGGWGPLRMGGLPAVEPFPVDVFPESVRRLVVEASAAIGCDPDLVALPVLAVAGGVIGRSASLRLKDNYFVTGCIYAAAIGPPSDGKTPSLKIVAAPIRKIDEAMAIDWKRDKAEYEEAKERYEAGKKTRPKGDAQESDPLDPPARPIPRRIDIDDVTMEVIPILLDENERGLIMIRDELTAFIHGMNQYKGGKGNDRSNVLKIWSGDAIKRDRVGHEDHAPVRVQFPMLTVVGGLTPDMLGEMADPRGRSDGFLDRFLMVYPDPRPVPEWSEVGLPPETAGDWAEVIMRLWQRPMRIHEGKPAPVVAHLNPAGKAAWKAGYNAHVREVNADDFPTSLRGPWGKFREYAGRLALILALLRHAADPTADPVEVPDVGGRDVADAWRLVVCFKGHTLRVAEAMRRREGLGEDARGILRWVKRNGLELFPQSDLTRNFPRFRDEPESLEAALKKLSEANVIRPRPERPSPPGKRGRKPHPSFHVNPALHASENCDNCSNELPTPDSGNFGNSPKPLTAPSIGEVA